MLRLRVVHSSRQSCYAGLHATSARSLAAGAGAGGHFCRPIRLDLPNGTEARVRYVGWTGDNALEPGTIELSRPFAECLGLKEGDEVEARPATEAPVAAAVMVQPYSSDDWEVVELQAGYIEERLLSQIAVLSPGMAFPVWIHGQMPVRLRVDVRDENRSECFLLARDTELMVEAKQRSRADRPMSVFGRPGGAAGGGGAAPSEPSAIRLRVMTLSEDMEAPTAFVHSEDLDRLAGFPSREGCLAWLLPPPRPPRRGGAKPRRGGDEAAGDGDDLGGVPQLLRVRADTGVPRGQAIVAAPAAVGAGVVCFSIVRVVRCRQVPVYVPDLELEPMGAWARRPRFIRLEESDGRWLRRLFRGFVRRSGEVDLMDGAILQLRSEHAKHAGSDSEESEDDDGAGTVRLAAGLLRMGGLGGATGSGGGAANGAAACGGAASEDATTTTTDLYEGLSDIDDIYSGAGGGGGAGSGGGAGAGAGGASGGEAAKAPRALEVTSAGLGVFEVDLMLDEDDEDDRAFGEEPSSAAAISGRRPATSSRPPRPEHVAVRVSFALGEAHAAALRQPRSGEGAARQRPPYARLTARTLSEGGMGLSVVWPELGAGGAEDEGGGADVEGVSPEEALAALWASTPGVRAAAEASGEQALSEVLRLVPVRRAGAGGLPLDGLHLFREAAGSLKEHLLVQLGCERSSASAAAAPDLAASASSPPSVAAAAPARPCSPGAPATCAPGAVAVVGGTGCGKTALCRRALGELAAEEGVLPIEVSCARLGQPSRKFKDVSARLGDILQVAARHAPSVVFLDDLGALCPDVEPGAPNLSVVEERSPILAELLLDMLPALRGAGARVALCATLPDDSAAHRALWRPMALEHKVPLRAPQLKERPEMLQLLCQQKADEGWSIAEEILREGALDDWGGRVDGFSVADLAGAVARAAAEAEIETGEECVMPSGGGTSVAGGDGPHRPARPRLALEHLERACEGFVPAAMTNQTFLASDIALADIGGLEGPKQELIDMLTMPTKYAALVDRAPVRTRKGMMLVGPPGCGKTMLVQAAAHETKGLLRFLTVKGPELLSKYIGESEAGVRRVFERAAAAAPAVVFFDELEALAPRRGADSTGVTDRVVNQMLCYLDGVEDRGRVYVLAATGRPDLVDPALMRPGRFDRVCYCGLPTDEERLSLCEVLAAKHNLVVEGSGAPHEDLRAALTGLVEKMPRLFTSADVSALFSSAKIEAVNEALSGAGGGGAGQAKKRGPPVVTMGHLYTALSTAKASVSEADAKRYDKIFEAYRPGDKPSAMEKEGVVGGGADEDGGIGRKVALA